MTLRAAIFRLGFVVLGLLAASSDLALLHDLLPPESYPFTKLGAMVALLLAVVTDPRFRTSPVRQRALVVAAWSTSFAGDAFLAASGFFLPGLASFLVAHVLYLLLFRTDTPWFPSRATSYLLIGYAMIMAGFLVREGIPAPLRLPVCAYTAVIALMAIQVVGRAVHRRTLGSRLAATGALLFLASDSLLALNRFVAPLPLSGLLVLSTYYAAQACLLGGWLSETKNPSS